MSRGIIKDEILTFERVFNRKRPRLNWGDRWLAACKAVKYKGVIKTKDGSRKAWRSSPVWKALGECGFGDCTHRSEPPFAFNSGMGWKSEEKEKKNEEDDIAKTLSSKEFEKELKKQLGLKDTTIILKL